MSTKMLSLFHILHLCVVATYSVWLLLYVVLYVYSIFLYHRKCFETFGKCYRRDLSLSLSKLTQTTHRQNSLIFTRMLICGCWIPVYFNVSLKQTKDWLHCNCYMYFLQFGVFVFIHLAWCDNYEPLFQVFFQSVEHGRTCALHIKYW